jgi:hypothetical protein
MRLNSRVESLHENEITLAGGESMRARAIVVATDGPAAAHLVGEAEPAKRQLLLLCSGGASCTATYAYAERRWRRPRE